MNEVEQVSEVQGAGVKSVRDNQSAALRGLEESATKEDAERLARLLQSLAETSREEIDRVISHLKAVRDMLRNEGERVTHECEGYERLSETVMSVVTSINDRLKEKRSAS